MKTLGADAMIGQLPRLDRIAKFLSERGSKFTRFEFSQKTSGQPTVEECLHEIVKKLMKRIRMYNA